MREVYLAIVNKVHIFTERWRKWKLYLASVTVDNKTKDRPMFFTVYSGLSF